MSLPVLKMMLPFATLGLSVLIIAAMLIIGLGAAAGFYMGRRP